MRESFWFETDHGPAWSISTAPWDFDLPVWIASDKLKWVELDGDDRRLHGKDRAIPFVRAAADVHPQRLAWGQRTLLELPTGEPINPFG